MTCVTECAEHMVLKKWAFIAWSFEHITKLMDLERAKSMMGESLLFVITKTTSIAS